MSKWEEFKIKNDLNYFLDLSENDLDMAKKRMLSCNDCDQLVQSSRICIQCGCFMPIKVQNPESQCPIGKW